MVFRANYNIIIILYYYSITIYLVLLDIVYLLVIWAYSSILRCVANNIARF